MYEELSIEQLRSVVVQRDSELKEAQRVNGQLQEELAKARSYDPKKERQDVLKEWVDFLKARMQAPTPRVFREFPQSGVLCILCHTNANTPCVLLPLDDTQEEGREQALPVHVDCVLSELRIMPIEDVHLLYKIARHE